MHIYSSSEKGAFLALWLSVALFGLVTCRTQDALTPEKVILSFTIQGITATSSVLDATARTVTLTVPYGVDRSAMVPIFTLSPGSTSVPASGKATDFRQPALFTLTAADGSKVIYTVTVKAASQPNPILTSLSSQTIEAGQSILLTGKLFGRSPQGISLLMTAPDSRTLSFPAMLLDSATLRTELPPTVSAALYQIKVVVSGLQSQGALPLTVQYPSPVLDVLTRQNILLGDSLLVSGRFILPGQYRYRLGLVSGTNSQFTTNYSVTIQGLLFALSSTIPAGRYQVSLQNMTDQKMSRDTTQFVQLYDPTKPFIRAAFQPKTSYSPGQVIDLQTVSYGSIAARFYQCQLRTETLSYSVNGVYTQATNRLTLTLPDNIKPADYQLSARLLSASGEVLYGFDTDLILVVR